ncbi:kinase [Clostridium felsineum]|uniref:GHMP family kinase ATP-binding protein n=1 Tax=Clostridium felsineum TaxID=36839 RepID=UPI00214DECD3|nr:kinase [Clostridium felsineum]MCR3757691.1 kinase [Clostridium felsineum]
MKARARYPASFGELVQGRNQGMDILISCPVNLFTEVTLFESKEKRQQNNFKSIKFLHNILTRWGLEEYIDDLDIIVNSNIPRGKGFASSTADLSALYYALLEFYGRQFNEKELIEECIKIEPTDSIIFNKLTVFDYKKGTYKRALGEYPKLYILAFEGRKIIDTISFNKRKLKKAEEVGDLIDKVKASLKVNNIEDIALASTESIIRNKARLNYEILDEVLRFKDNTFGLGILGAHSGDALGIIYDSKKAREKAMEKVFNIRGYKVYKLETLLKHEMNWGISNEYYGINK